MMLVSNNSTLEEIAELLDVGFVARLCGCSPRTIRRLADSHRMPRPVKVGGLVRWRRADVLDWIDGGCQPIQSGKALRK